MKTRVEKVARVQSSSFAVEENAQENIRHISKSQPLPFQLQNFISRAEAMEWLKGVSKQKQ